MAIQNELFNVRHFDAVGDGVANDTVAFQRCIAAANGRRIYVPGGDYLIDRIDLKGEFFMFGESVESTRLVGNSAGTMVGINGETGLGVNTREFILSDMTIDGNAVANVGIVYGQTGNGTKSANGLTKNVRVTGTITAGFEFIASQVNTLEQCWADSNNGAGFLFSKNTTLNTATRLVDCRAISNVKGVHIQQLRNARFTSFGGELNTEEAIYVEPVDLNDVQQLFFENLNAEQNCSASGSDYQIDFRGVSGAQCERVRFVTPRLGASNGIGHFRFDGVDVELIYPSLVTPGAGSANAVSVPNEAAGVITHISASIRGSSYGWTWGTGVTGDEIRHDGAAGFIYRRANGAGLVEYLRITPAGQILMPNLPTANPGATNVLWNNAGVINIT